MKHYIIYIPGLGDHYDAGRRSALKLWQLFGVKTQLVPMQWYAAGTYEAKVHAVLAAIEIAQKAGYTVSVIGESAGASMALNVAARVDSLHSVVLLAGIASNVTPISPRIKARSPSFAASVAALPVVAKKTNPSKIHVVQAVWDSTVPSRYNQIKGARVHTIWSVGHLTTIFICITILSPFIIHLAKSGSGEHAK